MKATVTKRGGLDMQVCVPKHWSDERAAAFAEKENSCGTEYGWHIRRQGSEYLCGADERTQCEEYEDHVHIMLDA